MNDALFGRRVELVAGGRQWVNELGADGPTIHFEIPFDDDKEPNVATIKVYNLSETSIAGIKKDGPVILNAGYSSDVGSVLLGFVEKVQTYWEGPDKITEIQAVDGSAAWLKTPIVRAYAAGTTASAILNDLSALTGLEIGAMSLPVDRKYPSGKTIRTGLSGALAAIAADCGAKAHVTRGKIYIRPKDEGQTIGFVIDAEHGLISSPTPIETETGKGKKKTKRQGFKVVSLLNHRITTDSIVEIKSKTANGMFRVEKGQHTSDGSRFYTEMEVYPV